MNARCEICGRNFVSEPDVEKHVLSKNCIKKCLYNNMIVVNVTPPIISIGDLIKFLSHFGEIKKNIVLHKNALAIVFNNHKPVKLLSSNKVCINGVTLNIYEVFANKHEDKSNNYPNNLAAMGRLNNQISFEEQLVSFLKEVSLTEEEIIKRYKPVCRELNRIFQTIFPKAKTYPFGSAVTGLGFKNCDLDLYLSIGLPVIDENYKPIGPHVITADAIFSLAKKILLSHKKTITNCVFIPSAKVPIIKFIYQPTNVHCDLSFQNRLAVYNSKLVKYYLSLDSRIRPLVMIIKNWLSKRTDIRITKYAMTMLIIFYFQQLKIVPPVIDLQKKCTVPLTVNGWQVNFSKKETFHITNHERNSTIPSLLQRFFDFYANYDFKTNVLCPLDGCSYSKDLFFEPENLPASMNLYKKYLKSFPNANVISIWKPMCLQDPHELCHNLTHNVIDIGLEKFQQYCAVTAKVVNNCEKNKHIDLLPNIFNLNSCDTSINKKEVTVVFDIYPNDFIVQKSATEQINDLFIKHNWFDLALNIFKQYLEQVLIFNVKTVNREGTPVNTSFENQNVIVLHCTGTHCLWNNRKLCIMTKMLPTLEKEIEISRIMIEKMNLMKNELKDDSWKAAINMECHLEKKTEPKMGIRCTIKDKGCSDKVLNSLANYLLGKLPTVIRKTLNLYRQTKNLNFNKYNPC